MKQRPPGEAGIPDTAPGWARRFKLWLAKAVPDRGSLSVHPLLRPVARHILGPHLWHMQHEAVARGVAIGIFYAFAMPFGQVIAAAAHCVWWRANIPVAAAITFLTNPFTVGFWLWLGYEAGSLIVDAPPFVMPGHGISIREWLLAIGEPVVLGMGMFAVFGSITGYFLVKLGWRLQLAWKRRQRALERKTRQSGHD